MRTVFFLLMLTTPIAAQTAHLFSPRHYGALEGDSACFQFGAWPAMRYQLIDGENLNGPTKTLKEISLRLDYRNHSSFTSAAGRTFSNVTIKLADGDLAKTTNDFAKNLRSTPTMVFSGRVHWPDFNGSPISKPAPWGGFFGSYRLPFQTAWQYDGKKELVSDWTFSGGALVNQATWSSKPQAYWFDSYDDPTVPFTGDYRYIPAQRLNNNSPGVTDRCNDSYFGTTAIGSFANIYVRVYGAGATDPNLRNNLVIWSASHYSEPATPVIHAWAFGVNESGVNLNSGCNYLHLTGIAAYFTHVTKPASVDPTGHAASTPIVTPWLIALSAVKVTVQAGWIDRTAGKLRLSQAQQVVLPGDKPWPVADRLAIYQAAGASVEGPHAANYYNPILRY